MIQRVKVLQIISGFAIEGPLGGIERFGMALAQALDQDQFEVILCGLWAYHTPYEYEWVRKMNELGIASFIAADWHESSPYQSFIDALAKIRQRALGPVAIIHSHTQFGDGVGLLLKRHLQARALVRTVHNEREWPKRPWRRRLLTNGILPLFYDKELGVAQQVVSNLNQRPLARLLRRRAILAYNALDIARFSNIMPPSPEDRRRLALPSEGPLIGVVGRLAPQKGLYDMLTAAQIVCRHIPKAHFIVVGEGEQRQELEAAANEMGLAEQVLFTGSRRDVEKLMPAFSLYLNSSHWEGLPTVIMESMAARVPIVATAVAGNMELIQHNKTGLLVPPHKPQQLASAIITLLTASPDHLSAMTEAAWQHLHQNFSITAVARQHEAIYHAILGH